MLFLVNLSSFDQQTNNDILIMKKIKTKIQFSKQITMSKTLSLNNKKYIRLSQAQKLHIFRQRSQNKLIDQLYLSDNQNEQILKQIIIIIHRLKTNRIIDQSFESIFSHLKYINLAKNNIHNIEGISTLPFETLERLCLHQNNIIKLKSLGKCRFQSLQTLYLSQNKQKEDCYSSFKRCSTSKLKNIILGSTQVKKTNNNFSYCLSLQAQRLDLLKLISKFQIKSFKLQRQVKAKYKTVELIVYKELF